MRDPKRIKEVLALIEDIWARNPDLRLCQIIQSCYGTEDIFYVEDEELIEQLKVNYEN